jgi:hypothetical protein
MKNWDPFDVAMCVLISCFGLMMVLLALSEVVAAL